MNTEEAKEILRQLIEFMVFNFGDQAGDVIEGLSEIITLIDKQQDEIESLWLLADEMSKSDMSIHEKRILEELDKIFKDKKKMAKVSEA